METMQFHLMFLRAVFFPHLGGLTKQFDTY